MLRSRFFDLGQLLPAAVPVGVASVGLGDLAAPPVAQRRYDAPLRDPLIRRDRGDLRMEQVGTQQVATRQLAAAA